MSRSSIVSNYICSQTHAHWTLVRTIFERYLALGSVNRLVLEPASA
jgi:hypothetical protein